MNPLSQVQIASGFRLPPQAVEVEKHVIGAALVDRDAQAQVVERLTEADFYLERHMAIFAALQAAQGRGERLDGMTLARALEASGRLAEAGGEAYLIEIMAEVVSSANLDLYLPILQEQAARRKLIAAATSALEWAYDQAKPIRDVQNEAEAAILAAGETRGRASELKPMSMVLKAAVENWQAIAMGQPGGLLSNFKPLDDIFLGFRPGKLYILAARPGLGKSMLALQVAKQCGQPVAHYSLEMLATEQLERMISQVSDLNSESLQSKAVLEHKWKMLEEAIASVRKYPIWFCDEPPITPANILSQCRRMKKKKGLGMIIADYLQLIKGIGKFERRDLEVGSVSSFLKGITMKLEVPILAIASLSRKNEDRTDKRPILSDLRESGSIESDADGVIFLYREADYNAKAREHFANVTEIIVPKNRGGRTGRSLAYFDGAKSLFYPLDQQAAKAYMDFLGQKGANDSAQANTGYPRQVSGKNAQSPDW
jgi:replicative DNA helicase